MNRFRHDLFATLVVFLFASLGPVSILEGQLLRQDREGGPAVAMTAAEIGTLGDPFFRLVLDVDLEAFTLERIEELIQPDPSQRVMFVVHEQIVNPSPFGQARRAVIAFRGTNGDVVVHRDVMLSVFFTSQGFVGDIESWGWDEHRGRYNYYKLDRTGTQALTLSWKFRGSSVNADLLSAADRQATCMACHVNGGPIMKELAIPWNNWHSFSQSASYLTPFAPAATRWPVASTPRLGTLAGAEDLETDFLLDAIRRFNTSRINQTLERERALDNVLVDADGRHTVLEGRRLLRGLFETTEINLISSRETSGMHPFGGASGNPSQLIQPPNALFLNVNLIAGNPIARTAGLGISEAMQFAEATQMTRSEYQAAVTRADLRLAGFPGDASFAWFVPEASHIDNDLVKQLMNRGIVPAQLVATVLAVDLAEPVFSEARASLLEFVPEVFRYTPLPPGTDPLSVGFDANALPADGLLAQLIANIEATSPASDTLPALFVERLRSADAVAALRSNVASLLAATQDAFATAATREAAIDDLMAKAVRWRREVHEHDTLHALDETVGGMSMSSLLPVPP